ncbi:MAG: tRNA lysidine(34) synthetase TilS [Tunicatimonas sp.]
MLETRFKAFIDSKALFGPNDIVLLAVSGGLDSTVLAHLFAQSAYPFTIAHANFGLRGAESDEDERWVIALAKRYEVPFYTHRFATKDYAVERGLSTQMAARRLRYAWLEEVRTEHGYARIATAHHQNDQLETTLLNLVRGTGVAGLRGMLPRRGSLVRPLLFAPREALEAYAQQHQLEWREDQSNASDAYRRNQLRHHVVPMLQQLNPNLLSTYERTRERLLATEQVLLAEVARVEENARQQVGDAVWLDKAALRQHPQATLILTEIIRPFGFSYQQARDITFCLSFDAVVGQRFLSAQHTLFVERQQLVIVEKNQKEPITKAIQASDTRIELRTLVLTLTKRPALDYELPRLQHVAALDYDRLRFPLQLRPWQAGDWFCPLGMEHRKKLSDFLIDQKVPRHRKDSVYVLTSDENIVWVVGWRIDHRFRVTDQTQKVYEISSTAAQ